MGPRVATGATSSARVSPLMRDDVARSLLPKTPVDCHRSTMPEMRQGKQHNAQCFLCVLRTQRTAQTSTNVLHPPASLAKNTTALTTASMSSRYTKAESSIHQKSRVQANVRRCRGLRASPNPSLAERSTLLSQLAEFQVGLDLRSEWIVLGLCGKTFNKRRATTCGSSSPCRRNHRQVTHASLRHERFHPRAPHFRQSDDHRTRDSARPCRTTIALSLWDTSRSL